MPCLLPMPILTGHVYAILARPHHAVKNDPPRVHGEGRVEDLTPAILGLRIGHVTENRPEEVQWDRGTDLGGRLWRAPCFQHLNDKE